MIDYKLAKELEEAGFPQNGEGGEIVKIYDDGESCTVYTPTLSELIDWCREGFDALHSVIGGFRADGTKWHEDDCGDDECGGHHHIESKAYKTPEEAAARLGLKLHENTP